MTHILEETFLGPGFPYVYANGPAEVPTVEIARNRGLNCVALAHLCVSVLSGYKLPRELLCTELYFDTEHFEPVDSADASVGDLVWLGRSSPTPAREFVPKYNGRELINWGAFPVNHVGVVVGRQDDLQILHASQYHGTITVSSLSDLSSLPRYAALHGLSRLRQEYEVIRKLLSA